MTTDTPLEKPSILSKIGSLLLSFLGTRAMKEVLVDLLSKAAAQSDNQVDDKVVELVRKALLENTKDVETLKDLHVTWTGVNPPSPPDQTTESSS